jgi:hypothetical protein
MFMKHKFHFLKLAAFTVMAILAAPAARAVDYHVNTAQALQNALTLAASDGANNTIWITNGYYTGNFNYNSSGGLNLTVTNEPGVANTQITLDGAGLGRALSIANSGTGAITVSGITFSRNCGSTSIGALRIAAGSGATILVNGCQFLSPANTSGEGLELDSGQNATVTNCIVTGATPGGASTGISISGVTGIVTMQNCTMTTNSDRAIAISGAGNTIIVGNAFSGNSSSAGSHYGAGVDCAGIATITQNTFVGNTSVSGSAGVYCGGTATITSNSFVENSNISFGINNSPGGAINCGGSATIQGNSFTYNSSGGLNGGAVNCNEGGTIVANTFFNNTGANTVGIGGAATISGNNFTDNHGGGVYASSTSTIVDNIFTGNSTTNGGSDGGNGGGLYCANGSTIVANVFNGNSSINYGGGAYCSGGSFTISSNSFTQNSAGTGGGLYVTGPTNILQDNLIFNNSQTSASSQGGGIWVDATSTLFMINNTITGNTAAGSGGGAAFEVTGTVELLNVYNNIIWGNSASGSGGDVWLAGTGQKKVFDFNDADSIYGVWDIAQNDIDAAPQFFNPVNGDYHFPGASPCANAGTNGAPSQPLTDLDGNNRTNSLGQIDLGCYEFNTTATHPADTNGDFVITPAEYAAYAAAWQNGQTWTNGPNPGPNPIPANYLTRAGYLMTNGLNGAYTNDGSMRPTNWKPVQ